MGARLQHNLRPGIRKSKKSHDPSLDVATLTRPCETLVRGLLCDLRIPLFVLARDLCFPMKTLGTQPLDFFHTFHELGKLLIARPLRVGGILRHGDFNGFLNDRHVFFISVIFGESVDLVIEPASGPVPEL